MKKTNQKIDQNKVIFPLDHISYSSMVKFSTNPILFKINYINKDRFDTTSNISGILGSAFHKAMEVYYGGSDTLIPCNESEAIEFGMKAGLSYLEIYNDGFINFSKTIPNKQKAYDLFTFCFQAFIKENPYKPDTIVSVEEMIENYINVEHRNKKLFLPIKLKAKIDKIVREDGRLIIEDYKTCYSFSDPEKIDGSKILQAIVNYLTVYSKYGEAPYSIRYREVKFTKNTDGSRQVVTYEIIFEDNELYFDFFFRFYEDMIKALNGEMVYVPNIYTLFDNEVSLISYIHRLDVEENTALLLKKYKVENITELLKKEIQNAGNMRKLMKTIEENFVSAKNLNYNNMKNEEKIQTKMMEYGMLLQFDSKIEGANVDLYRYTPSIGLKMSRIETFVSDVEQVLGVSGIRVLAPIKGSSMVGFEVPRVNRCFPKLSKITKTFDIAIGQDIMGQERFFDIRQSPHVLVAGASGSGKSVFLTTIIEQLLNIPNVELHLFDPKKVEMIEFMDRENVVEYLSDYEDIYKSLLNLYKIVEKRYTQMVKKRVKNIDQLNGEIKYKFVIIDEFGDLILNKDVENVVLKIAQKARACGIHLIISTQRPSTKIISGEIKANFPTKIALKTASAIDSRIILDSNGAEKLLGKGDLLFLGENGIERLQGYNL